MLLTLSEWETVGWTIGKSLRVPPSPEAPVGLRTEESVISSMLPTILEISLPSSWLPSPVTPFLLEKLPVLQARLQTRWTVVAILRTLRPCSQSVVKAAVTIIFEMEMKQPQFSLTPTILPALWEDSLISRAASQ